LEFKNGFKEESVNQGPLFGMETHWGYKVKKILATKENFEELELLRLKTWNGKLMTSW